MYYILYEGLKIDSNEPVYCILCSAQCALYTAYISYKVIIQ